MSCIAMAVGLCAALIMPATAEAFNADGTHQVNYPDIQWQVEQNLGVLKAITDVGAAYASENQYQESLRKAQQSYSEAQASYNSRLADLEASRVTLGLSDQDYDALKQVIDLVWTSQEGTLQQAIDAAKTGIDTLRFTQQTASLAVVSTKQESTNSAQQAFLNHYSLKEKRDASVNQKENLEWQIELAEIKLDRKIMSQAAFDTLSDSMDEVNLAIENYDTAIRKSELALKAALGVSAATPIQYGELPDLALIEDIPKRNSDSDRAVYLSRSAVIQNAGIAVNQANYSVDSDSPETFYKADGAKLSYEQSIESATQQFESAYGSLQDSYQSYKVAVKTHNTLVSDYKKLLTKQKNGKVSKNTVRNKKDEVLRSKSNVRAQQIDLYAQYQMYINGLTL